MTTVFTLKFNASDVSSTALETRAIIELTKLKCK